jgi:hypothetical protein
MSNLPPPPLDAPPIAYATPLPVSPDDAHLRMLAIFHYVWGGLVALGFSVFLIHVVLGIVMIVSPASMTSRGEPPPAAMGWLFVGIGSAAVLVGWALGGLSIYSGRCISRRRHHTFSLVMAGINCLSIPLGTALGVFTFIVLLRPTVKAQYDGRRTLPA